MLQGSNASTGAKNQMPQNVDAMAAFGRHGVCALPEEDALVLFAQIAGSIVLRLAALTLSKRSLKVAMLKRLQASAPRGMRRCRGRSTGLVGRATNALQSARLPTAVRFPGSGKKSMAVVVEMTKGNPAAVCPL